MSTSPRTCRSGPRFVGDPIDVTTGANTDIITDIAQRGPLEFRWTRYYNSALSKVHLSLGWGHAHHFDRLLVRDLDGLRYQDPLGALVEFETPTYTDVSNGGLVLSWTASNSYLITQAGQPDQEFHFAPGSDIGRLSRIRREQSTIQLRYNESGVLREIIDSLGRLIRVISDAAGRVLRLVMIDQKTGQEASVLLAYEYDPAGNLVRATDLRQTTISFAYDPANRMTRRTDRRGYSFHFEYDDQGRCIHSRGDDGLLEVFLDYQPDAGTTFVRRGDGGQWIYAYNQAKTITQITDPYGHATKFILDDMGRPVQEIDPNGNVTILHYDWRGGHDYRIDPNGHVLPTREANPNPDDPLGYVVPTTALQWDFGRLVDPKTIGPPQAQDPLLAQFPGPVVNTVLGRTSTYGPVAVSSASEDLLYTDDFGRALEYHSPSFSENWKYDANGNLVEHRDRDGSVSRYTYQSWNGLEREIDPLGNSTSIDFTAQGLVAKVSDPGGTVTEYGYDLTERLIEVREVGRLVERYRRDPAGNIVEKADGSGRTLVRYEVGPGNLTKVRTLASGEKHVFEHNGNGRIIMAETPAGKATMAYDEEGHLVADQRDGRGVAHEFDFQQLVTTNYFDRFKVSYRSFDNGDLRVEDPTGGQHRFQIGATGLVVKRLANGARELCQFDIEGRCRRKAVVRDSRDAPWMRNYAYSDAGDLLGVADSREGTTTYRFDAAHRLIEEAPPAGPPRRFEHDVAGNLVRQPGLTGVAVGEGNRLSQANGEVLSYNDRGHLAQRQGSSAATRYEYNELDMLVRCDLKGQTWTASYDGIGRRVQKTWRDETTTYYWDDLRLAAEVRHDGSCRLYIYADHTALAPFLFIEYESVDSEPESGKRYYIFTNQVSAPIRVEDDTGRTVWSARIDPYGAAQVDPASTVEVTLRYPGHYLDKETGLHYNRFRYFSHELGRYLQSDPWGQAGGINVYSYPVNPLTGVDIDGLGKARGDHPQAHSPAKHPPIVNVPGCTAAIGDPATMSDAELKAALERKANALRQQIEEAKAAGATHVRCPDGTVLDVRDTRMGACLSVVLDKKTGNVTYGQNNGTVNPNLVEPLKTDAKNRAAKNNEDYPKLNPADQGKSDARRAPAGSHSEVNAANKAMDDRDKGVVNGQKQDPPSTTDPAKKEDLVVYNQNLDGQSQEKGAGKPCCPDCKAILGTGQPGGAKDVSEAK